MPSPPNTELCICEHVNEQMSRRTLTLPPSEENGAERGAAKARLGRPGIQSRGWPGLGVSAPGSQDHLRDTIFPGQSPATLLPSPLIAPNSFPPPYLRHPSTGKGSFRAPAARLPYPQQGYLLQKRDRGQGTRGGEAARRNEGRGPGEEGGRRRRRLSLAFPCSQRCHYCARGRLPGRPPPPALKTRGVRREAREPARWKLTCRRAETQRSRVGTGEKGSGEGERTGWLPDP